MEQHLRHRSASGGSLVNHWDFDWSDRCILASIQVASAQLVHVAIRVLPVANRDANKNEYAIWSVSSSREVWRVERGVFDAHLPPPHPWLPVMGLLLTNTPVNIANALAAL